MNTTSTQERHTAALDIRKWHSHPRFPAQTLLLGSHENFRQVSEYLVDQAAKGESVRSIGAMYRRWIAAMRSHEAYEEGKLYPVLERRWHVSTEAAAQGHHALHSAHDAVLTALADATPGTVGRAGDALHRALVRHDRVLNDHLSLEEDLVVPHLLALSPEEFAEYCDQPIGVLLEQLGKRALKTEVQHGQAR